MDVLTLIQVLDSTIRLATPLLLACLAGLYSERAGIFDIGLEGKMLMAAFFSAAVAALSGSVWLGLLAGIASSMVLSGLHGLASITFRGNQLISGVAINFLASGLTVLIAQDWFRQGGRTPSLMGGARFEGWELPFAIGPRDAEAAGRPLNELMSEAGPVMQVYSELISGHSILVYAGFLAVPLTWWVLFRTRFGLRLRAVGENPAAVDTAGVSVVGLRYAAVAIAGVLCGIAGAYLATALQAGFVKEMTAGRGFIALAALIFAKWRPWHAMGACLLFGFLQAVALRYQNIDTGFGHVLAFLCVFALAFALVAALVGALRRSGYGAVKAPLMTAVGLFAAAVLVQLVPVLDFRVLIPVQVMDALPYILTVVILAGFVGKAVPPRAGGAPYVKER